MPKRAQLPPFPDLIPLRQAHPYFKREKPIPHPTLRRWRLEGVRGSVLKTWVIGQTRYTSVDAIRAFIAGQNS